MMSWPFELFLALRYLRPRRTFVSVITVLSVLGVTLGVMVLIVVLSVMAGFEQELKDKVIGFNAHLILTNNGVMRDGPELIQEIQKDPSVLAATPYVSGPVLAEYNGRVTTPVIKGIDPNSEDKVVPMKKYVVLGEYELRGDSVLVGIEWARRNFAQIGDHVLIYSPRNLKELKNQAQQGKAVLLPTEMVITGIFSTGLFDYDLNFMLTSLFNAQRLYDLGGGIHGIAVAVKNPLQVDALKDRFNNTHPLPLQARTWKDQNRPLFNAIATERVTMSFVLFFIMIVAAFGLCSTLITITVQKSREIGLLKALGAGDFQVLTVFVLHGWVVGVIGAVAGVGLALLILAYRNPFRMFLSRVFHIDVFAADIYAFPEIPAVIDPALVGGIAFSAIIICVVAALIPARGAARLAPAQALRYE